MHVALGEVTSLICGFTFPSFGRPQLTRTQGHYVEKILKVISEFYKYLVVSAETSHPSTSLYLSCDGNPTWEPNCTQMAHTHIP